MNIYTAILRAADHIERNPSEFAFCAVNIPSRKHCGFPGCAIGWIGYFAGVNNALSLFDVSRDLLGIDHRSHMGHPFYERMSSLTGSELRWRKAASECARGLRLYAEKYHRNDKPATRSDAQLVAALLSKLATPVSEAVSEELTW